jgi:hypothetical protein
MSRPYRLGRREEAAGQTREKILQATADLLTEAGVRGVTIEGVASEAGVWRGGRSRSTTSIESGGLDSRRTSGLRWPTS